MATKFIKAVYLKNDNFIALPFTFLKNFRFFVVVAVVIVVVVFKILITFWPVLVVFGGSEKS